MFKRRKPDDIVTDEPDADTPTARADPMPTDASASRATGSRDNWGVPPYRPAPPASAPFRPTTSQEAQAMGRAPFPPSPPAPPPRPGTAIPPNPLQASGPLQNAGPAQNMGSPRPLKDASEKRTLVVGRGISVQGTVQDAERLVVEGTVEASMIHAAELQIAPGGVFRGEVQVQDAEVAGTIDGTLTASGNLIIRSTGRLLGTAKCRRLQVEDGGQVTGRIEMLSDQAAATDLLPPTDPFRPAPQLPEAAQPQPEDMTTS